MGLETKEARDKVLAERESRWRKHWAELGLELEEEPA